MKYFIFVLFVLSLPESIAFAAVNSITVTDLSGGASSGHPFTLSRVFVQGEIVNFPKPTIGGSAPAVWQADIKNRWPDGSVKHALISFLAAVGANASVTILFVNDANPCSSGNQAACDAASLSQVGMLAFDTGGGASSFGAAFSGVASSIIKTANIRTMIGAGNWTYWLRGPAVTQVIAEDRTSARAHDFGWSCTSGCTGTYSAATWISDTTSRSMHPIFVATFYPGFAGVKVEYILENAWTTLGQDQAYDVTLTAGNGSPVTVFTKSAVKQWYGTRWRKTFWAGTTPAVAKIDYNTAYLIQSKAIPTYDLTATQSANSINASIASWNATDKAAIEGEWLQGATPMSGSWLKYMPQTGGREEIGLFPTWTTRYLYTMHTLASGVDLYNMMIGNGEVSGYVPIHFRESTPSPPAYCALSAQCVSQSLNAVSAYGRPVSRDAFPTGGNFTTVAATSNAHNWSNDNAHQGSFAYIPYLITGDWYFLEELYFMNSNNLSVYSLGTTLYYQSHNDWCYIVDQLRGDAWTWRTLGHVSFIAPDGTPEKAYFTQKLLNNITIREGKHNITNGYGFSADNVKWQWGFTRASAVQGNTEQTTNVPNPLNIADWDEYGSVDGTDPAVTQLANSQWMLHFWLLVLGHLDELGLPVTKFKEALYRNDINQLQNPAYNPWLIGNYRTPALALGHTWFTTWPQLFSGFLSSERTRSTWYDGGGNLEGSYDYISRAAAQFYDGINDGSYTGTGARQWFTGKVDTSGFTFNPKWAFAPRAAAVGGDITPPTIPTGLSATALSSSAINLAWIASTDAVGVTGYTIFRNGSQIGTSAINSYSDAGLASSTLYSYVVSAQDAAANSSAQSSPASATTQGAGITNIRQTGSTPREVILSYVVSSPTNCTIEVSESPTYAPLVNDVNTALFASSNSDFRNGPQGRNRTFVIGAGGIGMDYASIALDNYRRSRALQVNTDHFYRLTCGTDIVTGIVRTANLASGDTYPKPIVPVDPATPGANAWPFMPWDSSGAIDPTNGVFAQSMTAINGVAPDYFGPFAMAYVFDEAGTWTNAANGLAIDTAVTSYTGAANDPLKILHNFGALNENWTDIVVAIKGFVDNVSTTAEICLTVNGATCYGKWVPIPAMPVGTLGASVTVGVPVAYGATLAVTPGMWGTWLNPGQNPPQYFEQGNRNGTFSNIATAVTLTGNETSGAFDPAWTSNTHFMVQDFRVVRNTNIRQLDVSIGNVVKAGTQYAIAAGTITVDPASASGTILIGVDMAPTPPVGKVYYSSGVIATCSWASCAAPSAGTSFGGGDIQIYSWTISTGVFNGTGTDIHIGTAYKIASVTDSDHLALASSPYVPANMSAPWRAMTTGFLIRKSSVGGTLSIDGMTWDPTRMWLQNTNLGQGGQKQCTTARYHTGFRIGGPEGVNVNALTNTAPINVHTSSVNDFVTGDIVKIKSPLGNTAAAGTWTITVAGNQDFSLNGSDGTASGAFPDDSLPAKPVYNGGGGLVWKLNSPTGHFCHVFGSQGNADAYWINPDTTPATVHYLGPIVTSTIPSDSGDLSSPPAFDELDPDVPSIYRATVTGGVQKIFRGTYMGSNFTGMFQQANRVAQIGASGITVIWKATDMTASTSLTAQLAAFDATYSGGAIAVDKTIKPGVLAFSARPAAQNTLAWIGVYDTNTQQVLGLTNTWGNANARFCGLHTALGWEGADAISWVPYELNGVESANSGPYRMAITGGSALTIANATATCAAQLTAISAANPLNLTSSDLCTTVTVSTTTPITPGTSSPANDTRGSIRVGDILRWYTAGMVNGDEYSIVAGWSGLNLVVQRNYHGALQLDGGNLGDHAANGFFTMFCSVSPRWWNYTQAPHGENGADPYNQNLTGHTIDKPFGDASHYFTRNSFTVNDTGGYAGNGFPCPSATQGYAAQYSFRNYPWPNHIIAPTSAYGCTAGDPAFGGVHSNGQGQLLDKHPSPVDLLASSPSFFDARTYFTYPGMTQVVTKVGTYIYKSVAGDVSTPNSGYNQFQNFDEKRNKLFVAIGHKTVLDVSAPGFTLPDTIGYNFTYCYTRVAGACFASSLVGDVYVNAPFVTPDAGTTSTYNCHYKGTQFTDIAVNDICVGILAPYADAIVQYSATHDPFNSGARRVSSFGVMRTSGTIESSPVLPTGNWAITRSFINNSPIVSMLLMKIPPYPGPQKGINRADFIPIPITISTVPRGTTSVTVEFGYNPSFFCSTRQEACVTVASSIGATPYYWAADTYTRLSCSSSCTPVIPALSQRILWSRIKYWNAGGVVIKIGNTQISATP